MKEDYKFTIGCDPEFILTNNGMICSAIGIVPGSKHKPYQLDNGAGLQTDNVAVEFASPVCRSVIEFIDSIKVTMGLIQRNLPEGYGLVSKPSAIFPDSELDNDNAREFGCSPDYNCWTDEKNPVPKATNLNLRSFGGHVHIGTPIIHAPKAKLIAAQLCDLFMGIPSLLLDNTNESKARRELYGKAGSYRPTKYGIEYRVLSNFWTASDNLIAWVYNSVNDIVDCFINDNWNQILNDFRPFEIERTINDNDIVKAESLLDYIAGFISETTHDALINGITMAAHRG